MPAGAALAAVAPEPTPVAAGRRDEHPCSARAQAKAILPGIRVATTPLAQDRVPKSFPQAQSRRLFCPRRQLAMQDHCHWQRPRQQARGGSQRSTYEQEA